MRYINEIKSHKVTICVLYILFVCVVPATLAQKDNNSKSGSTVLKDTTVRSKSVSKSKNTDKSRPDFEQETRSEINKLRLAIEIVKKYNTNLFFGLVGISILLILLLFYFSSIIRKTKDRLPKLEQKPVSLSQNYLSDPNTSVSPISSEILKNPQHIEQRTPSSLEEDTSSSLTPPPVSPTFKQIYFGGPAKGGNLLIEYQTDIYTHNRSIFELTIYSNDISNATFIPINNEFSVTSIVTNRELFESVCTFENFLREAKELSVKERGEAVLQGDKWEVRKKAIVRFV